MVTYGGIGCANYIEKSLTEPNVHMILAIFQSLNISIFCFRVKTAYFYCNSYREVFLEDTAN
jgi:hypothetical protein